MIFSSENRASCVDVLSSECNVLKTKCTVQEKKNKNTKRNTMKQALPEPFDIITSSFFFFFAPRVCIYIFTLFHTTLTLSLWNLQRFKEIKTFPQNMLLLLPATNWNVHRYNLARLFP